MSDIFAIRNVETKTKEFIYQYAHENKLNVAEALEQIVFLTKEHLKEINKTRQKKKYASLFDNYEKLKFTSKDSHLSEKIDEIAYDD